MAADLAVTKHTALRHLSPLSNYTAVCRRHFHRLDTLVVMVRDPLRWAWSMCGTLYKNLRAIPPVMPPNCTGFAHTPAYYSNINEPALVVGPTAEERAKHVRIPGKTIDFKQSKFPNLMHAWMAYHKDLLDYAESGNAPYRVIFLRYESLVLNVKKLVPSVCSCVTGADFASEVSVVAEPKAPSDTSGPKSRGFNDVHAELSSPRAQEELYDRFSREDLNELLDSMDPTVLRKLGLVHYLKRE